MQVPETVPSIVRNIDLFCISQQSLSASVTKVQALFHSPC